MYRHENLSMSRNDGTTQLCAVDVEKAFVLRDYVVLVEEIEEVQYNEKEKKP